LELELELEMGFLNSNRYFLKQTTQINQIVTKLKRKINTKYKKISG